MNPTILIDILKAIVMGIVEGITEFLPISSTGHLIVVGDLINFPEELAPTFEIFIQLGGVLAVLWFYHRDIWNQFKTVTRDRGVQRFWLSLIVAFIPAGLLAFFIHDWIKAVLFSPTVVAFSMIIGGFVLLWADRRKHNVRTHALTEVGWKQGLGIGLAQTLALIPGVSRSASSIIGGLLTGLDRVTATAFSFYLALPTLGMATIFSLATDIENISAYDALLLAVGTLTAFLTALVAIGWLLRYLAHHDFRIFAYYRIVVGILVLVWVFWRGFA